MPTVLRLGDLRVVIYPNDHRPAHVHVMGPDREVVYLLHCPAGPPELRENFGFSRADVNRIQRKLATVLDRLCDRWRAIHDHF